MLKSIVSESDKQEYPCLWQWSKPGVIVLLTAANEGTVVKGTRDCKLGSHSPFWPSSGYEYHGTIIITG